jgi:hypothetical protein
MGEKANIKTQRSGVLVNQFLVFCQQVDQDCTDRASIQDIGHPAVSRAASAATASVCEERHGRCTLRQRNVRREIDFSDGYQHAFGLCIRDARKKGQEWSPDLGQCAIWRRSGGISLNFTQKRGLRDGGEPIPDGDLPASPYSKGVRSWFIFRSRIVWRQAGCWQRNFLLTTSGVQSCWAWHAVVLRWDSPWRIDYTFLWM